MALSPPSPAAKSDGRFRVEIPMPPAAIEAANAKEAVEQAALFDHLQGVV
jgi:hypothetical protein